jgi:hypothetical protein
VLLIIVSQTSAVTRVYVQNNTPLTFNVECAQTGYPLADDKWGADRAPYAYSLPPGRKPQDIVAMGIAGSNDRIYIWYTDGSATSGVSDDLGQRHAGIRPGERAEVVWFNRDSGIKDGKSFVFTTTLSCKDLPAKIQLIQSLRGKPIGSHMWQSLAVSPCSGNNNQWQRDKSYDDRDTHVMTTDFASGRITFRYRAFFTGGDDDIEYILQREYEVPSTDPSALSLLAYNIYMRPTSLFKNGQAERAGLLPPKLRGYDVIVFSEAFDDDCRADLVGGLRPWYPYDTGVLGSDRFAEQDGGVIIVSHWPIEEVDERLFGDVTSGDDAWADKGALGPDGHRCSPRTAPADP